MNINEKNDNYEKFKQDYSKLLEEYKINSTLVIDKYPDYRGSGGLDGAPYSKELKDLQMRFSEEYAKLKKIYGI